MADVLSSYKQKALQWQLKVSTEFPLHYIRVQNALNQESVVCIEIPCPLLRMWSQLLEGGSGHAFDYHDLVNLTVMDGWFTIKRMCQRTEGSIRKHASYAQLNHKRLTC